MRVHVVAAMLAALTAGGVVPPSRPSPSVAIPGSALRLGSPVTVVDSLAASRRSGRQPSGDGRRGSTRFFGLPAEVDLEFESGVLARATFSVDTLSTHSRDYIEDQIRLSGFRRSCDRFDEALHDCMWVGAINLHIKWQPGSLSAEATPIEPAIAAPPPVAAPPPPVAASFSPAPPASPAITPPVALPPAAAPPSAATQVSGAAVSPSEADAPILPDTLQIGGAPEVAARHRSRTITPPERLAYPEAARDAGVQGIVRLLATVDSRGYVSRLSVLHGIPELNAAALAAARRCHFVPMGPPGSPAGFRVVIAVTFTRP